MAIPLRYNLRSVLVRRTGTLMAVLSVAATVAVFISVMALWRGLESAFTATGHPLNLVVIRQGSQVETNSSVEREKLQTLKYLAGVGKDSRGEALVSGELQVLVFLPRSGAGRANVLMRGVSRFAHEQLRRLGVRARKCVRPVENHAEEAVENPCVQSALWPDQEADVARGARRAETPGKGPSQAGNGIHRRGMHAVAADHQ